jgi:hypothetical protein
VGAVTVTIQVNPALSEPSIWQDGQTRRSEFSNAGTGIRCPSCGKSFWTSDECKDHWKEKHESSGRSGPDDALDKSRKRQRDPGLKARKRVEPSLNLIDPSLEQF